MGCLLSLPTTRKNLPWEDDPRILTQSSIESSNALHLPFLRNKELLQCIAFKMRVCLLLDGYMLQVYVKNAMMSTFSIKPVLLLNNLVEKAVCYL